MSNLKRRLFLVIGVGAVFAVGLIIWTLPQWWYRIGTAEPGAAMYKSWSGEVLFVYTNDSLQDQYIFYPSSNEIGIPSGGQLHVSPVLVFSNEAPVPVVLFSNKIKVETDMDIVVDDSRLEFTTRRGVRIKVDRSSF